jgi:hypothetical protein
MENGKCSYSEYQLKNTKTRGSYVDLVLSFFVKKSQCYIVTQSLSDRLAVF